MAHNIAVVGAVIHMGVAHTSQMFASTMGHQAALISGFGIDEQAVLLTSKLHLM